MATLRFLLRNLDHYANRFWTMLGCAFFDGAVAFLIPVLLAEFTKSELSVEGFRRLVPVLILCFAASLALQWFLRKDGEAFGKEFANHLRLKYFKLVSHLDIMTLGKYHSGYLLSLVTKICDGSTQVLFQFTWLVAHSISTLSLFFIFTARESFAIAAVNLAVLFLFLIVSVILSKKILPLFSALNLKHASLVERYVDLMANVSTIKRLSIFKFAESQISWHVQQNATIIRALQLFHANRWLILHVIYGTAFLSTISFLLYRVATGSVPASILVLFIAAYATIRSQAERLSELVKDLMELNAYISQLGSIIDGARRSNGTVVKSEWSRIELREISYYYESAHKLIKIPEFVLNKGDRVGLTGESGQGKSTLLGILSGFLEVDNGKRLIDGNPYQTVSSESLAKMFALASQDVELFNLTLRENLALGESILDQDLLSMIDALNLSDWFSHLPDRLETIVGEKGLRLSAGQKQRINIARALLLNREIILLDEPTSHLDDHTERVVIDLLSRSLSNKTVVFVTHRPRILELCNSIYEFKDGILACKS